MHLNAKSDMSNVFDHKFDHFYRRNKVKFLSSINYL